jgi:hypothetical protein
LDATDSDAERERTAPLVECLWTCLHALIDATAALRLTQFVPESYNPDRAVTKASRELMASRALKHDPVLKSVPEDVLAYILPLLVGVDSPLLTGVDDVVHPLHKKSVAEALALFDGRRALNDADKACGVEGAYAEFVDIADVDVSEASVPFPKHSAALATRQTQALALCIVVLLVVYVGFTAKDDGGAGRIADKPGDTQLHSYVRRASTVVTGQRAPSAALQFDVPRGLGLVGEALLDLLLHAREKGYGTNRAQTGVYFGNLIKKLLFWCGRPASAAPEWLQAWLRGLGAATCRDALSMLGRNGGRRTAALNRSSADALLGAIENGDDGGKAALERTPTARKTRNNFSLTSTAVKVRKKKLRVAPSVAKRLDKAIDDQRDAGTSIVFRARALSVKSNPYATEGATSPFTGTTFCEFTLLRSHTLFTFALSRSLVTAQKMLNHQNPLHADYDDNKPTQSEKGESLTFHTPTPHAHTVQPVCHCGCDVATHRHYM